MSQSLRIAIAEDDPITRSFIEECLTGRGHIVVGAVADGARLVDLCRAECPDLIVTDIKLPQVDGLMAVREICRDEPVPVIFITGYDDIQRAAQAAQQCGVFLYLVKPISEHELVRGIDLLMGRYGQFMSLVHNGTTLDAALADWPLIQHAKDSLMGGQGLDDEGAFDQLRKLAQRKGLSMADTARDVLAWDRGQGDHGHG